MNSNEPGSSGVVTAADSIEPTTETTTQHPAAVEIDKQASERAREASERARAGQPAGRRSRNRASSRRVRSAHPGPPRRRASLAAVAGRAGCC